MFLIFSARFRAFFPHLWFSQKVFAHLHFCGVVKDRPLNKTPKPLKDLDQPLKLFVASRINLFHT